MLTEIDFEACCRRLAPLLATWEDVVVPGQVETSPNAPYSPAYGWMYAYERQLRRRIEEALGHPLGPAKRRLFGADGALSEALSNAFLHGHGRDPRRPIQVQCAVGRAGLAFAVHDEGPGFDAAAVAAAEGRGRAYFRVGGNGFKAFGRAGIVAGYTDGGRTITLLLELSLA